MTFVADIRIYCGASTKVVYSLLHGYEDKDEKVESKNGVAVVGVKTEMGQNEIWREKREIKEMWERRVEIQTWFPSLIESACVLVCRKKKHSDLSFDRTAMKRISR